jgi:hypothetical protein
MRKLIGAITAAVIAVWSLIAWIVYKLIGFGGNVAAANVDIVPVDPEAVEWLSWLAQFGASLGEWAVIAVWAIVAAIIALIGYIAAQVVPNKADRRRLS